MNTFTSLQRIDVPLNKDKAFLCFMVCVAALVGGIAMHHDKLWAGWFVAVAAGAGILFFGSVLADRRPGLILEPEALIINGKVGSGGRVPWVDVTTVALVYDQRVRGSQWFLVIRVKNSENYLEQDGPIYRKGAIYRRLNSISAARFGSPVCVNLGLLEFDRLKLEHLTNEYLDRYGEKGHFADLPLNTSNWRGLDQF